MLRQLLLAAASHVTDGDSVRVSATRGSLHSLLKIQLKLSSLNICVFFSSLKLQPLTTFCSSTVIPLMSISVYKSIEGIVVNHDQK